MNNHIKTKEKQIQAIRGLLENAKMSQKNYESSREPFFLMNQANDYQDNYESIPELPEALNRHFKLLYEIVGNPEVEIYIGEWTLMSLNEALEKYKQYCSDGQSTIFDIGFRYLGMGHIEVLSCNLYNHLLFYRRDGGSNGWDREANYKELIEFKYQKYEYLYFTEWLKAT